MMDVNPLLAVLQLAAAAIVIVDVWRSPASTAAKTFWSLVALVFSVITLVVWLVWGRKRAHDGSF